MTHIELEKIGIAGNAHFMMMERNNREVLQPILDFLDKTITPYAQQKWLGSGRARRRCAQAARPRPGQAIRRR